ncbi:MULTISPECIES: carboxypeptidase-like regulatory domain-containing protein [unclassified Carboxylicivirga]|uniref:carboxypeptidase-like regulatory domain-containing protein n=1 Tax=Carboxylicivirga TaxID=1628153 RepID=UPI003D32BD57
MRIDSISIEALFDTLSNRTNIAIAYDVNAIAHDSLVNVNITNKHALHIVQEVLKHHKVEISFLNGQIIIGEKEAPEIQKKSLVITGTVYDAQDHQPLPLVNIAVAGKPLGSITNSQGQYEFKLPPSYTGEELTFSFLGYNSHTLTIPGNDSLIEVHMHPTSIRLAEVEVSYKDPNIIIDKVRSHQSLNYFDEQTLLEGFFRETIQQDGHYVQVSEAIVHILKPGYMRPANLERVKFIKGRKKNDLQQMNFVDFKLEGGPFQFSRIDIARYQDFYPDDNQLYKYVYDGMAVLNDELVYKIRFRPINDNGDLLYSGILYVHTQHFTLLRSEFQLTRKALKSSGKTLIRKTSGKIKVKPLQATYFIDYRSLNTKWIVNRVRGEVVIKINDKRQRINSVFTAVSELLISDCEINKQYKFKPSERYKSNYVLSDQITETDQEFWKDYNIIRPDEALESVFKK